MGPQFVQSSKYCVPMGQEHANLHRIGQHVSLTGERLQMTTIYMPAGAKVDWHQHDQESFIVVIQGSYRIWVAQECFELEPGFACYIPANTPHRAVVGPEPTIEIEIFSPPREDWADISPDFDRRKGNIDHED